MKKLVCLLMAALMALGMLPVLAETATETATVTANVSEIQKYGNIVLDISGSALLEAGVRIPHDVRVASLMNRGNELAFGRRITGFGHDAAADADDIAGYVTALLDGGNPRPPLLRWRFFPGESV